MKTLEDRIEERLRNMRRRSESAEPGRSAWMIEVFGREVAELNERLADLDETMKRVARNGEEALEL